MTLEAVASTRQCFWVILHVRLSHGVVLIVMMFGKILETSPATGEEIDREVAERDHLVFPDPIPVLTNLSVCCICVHLVIPDLIPVLTNLSVCCVCVCMLFVFMQLTALMFLSVSVFGSASPIGALCLPPVLL